MTAFEVPPAPDYRARIRALAAAAIASLDPQDRAERIAFCRRDAGEDQPAISITVDPLVDVIELQWGGRPLTTITPEQLAQTTTKET
ncbi:hypothetical protein NWT09_13140 [Mycolicibacterium sp. jd]|uniref:hypothetical protein n=1 Tax=unclassified Mycolicibacterium TaxID=2636767 RepID=UPI00351AB1D1